MVLTYINFFRKHTILSMIMPLVYLIVLTICYFIGDATFGKNMIVYWISFTFHVIFIIMIVYHLVLYHTIRTP